jgi:hypothetical protein
MTDGSEHEAVGYAQPPSGTRFKPGCSGNPLGRPKKRGPSFRDALLSELATAMPGTNPEHARSKLQALVRTLVDAAIGGNARAQSIVVGALARIGDAEESGSPSLTPDDQEILDAYVAGELQRSAAETDPAKAATERPAGARDDRRHVTADQQNKKGPK